MAATTFARESADARGHQVPKAQTYPGDKVEPEAAAPEESDKPKPMARRTKIILAVVALVLALGGLLYYLHSRGYEDTDDAQIDGNLGTISARVSGTVRLVPVTDNQAVKAGAVLVELDPADLDVAVAQARAQVAQAEAMLEAEDPNVPITETSNEASRSSAGSDLASSVAAAEAARAEIDQLSAQVDQAEANDRTAQLDKARAVELVEKGAITRSELDTKVNAAAGTAAAVAAAMKSLVAARARLGESMAKVASSRTHLEEVKANAPRQVASHRATVAVRRANVDLAKAQLAQAELNRSYATVRAPVDGVLGKKSVNVGDQISPGQGLMALSETNDLWVTANFRETQLEKMHVGQKAKIHVDALGRDFTGSVESMGGATGSRFSVLPPENATGNYVKVVQRIPVRIHLDPGQAGAERLRQGMSVEPTVTLR